MDPVYACMSIVMYVSAMTLHGVQIHVYSLSDMWEGCQSFVFDSVVHALAVKSICRLR